MYSKDDICKGYTEAINQCAKILNDVDIKFHTYGEIEIDNVNVTTYGEQIPQYIRKLEWRRILVQ